MVLLIFSIYIRRLNDLVVKYLKLAAVGKPEETLIVNNMIISPNLVCNDAASSVRSVKCFNNNTTHSLVFSAHISANRQALEIYFIEIKSAVEGVCPALRSRDIKPLFFDAHPLFYREFYLANERSIKLSYIIQKKVAI